MASLDYGKGVCGAEGHQSPLGLRLSRIAVVAVMEESL